MTMSTAPKILALQEIEPPPALAEALSPEFLRPLRIENPPAVQLMKLEKWGGFCSGEDFTQEGEVVLASEPRAYAEVERFRGTYLHEISHRFLSGRDKKEIGGHHGPVFFALQGLLFLRLPAKSSGFPWIWTADLYDLHDVFGEEHYSPGQALDWACSQADRLASAEISAEAAAEEITRRFAVWRSAMAAAPGKRRAARAKEKEKEEELARVRNKLFGARIYLCVALSFSFFLFVILFFDR